MLDCISRNLTEHGMGLITVPSFEYILDNDGYYELIRDHIAYYTFETLRYLLESHGFEVLEEEMVNRDTLAVIVRKTGAKKAGQKSAIAKAAEAEKVNGNAEADKIQTVTKEVDITPVNVSGLVKNRDKLDAELETLVNGLKKENKTMAVWGASHQGFTLTATTHLKDSVSYIIDSAPFKQGRFAPGSGLPIVPPDYVTDHMVDAILIVAPGYTEEIAGNIRKWWGEQIRILTLRSEKVEELS